MTGCCNARGCDTFFTERLARRAADRYREKGLDKTAKRIVSFIDSRGLDGASVLEIGGGVGELGIELLKRGAGHVVNLELSPGYAEEAQRLLREEGLDAKAEWRLHDIASDPNGIDSADVVVLHRVVCCYPDYARLLGAAAVHARRLVVFSYPPRNALSRVIIGAQNRVFRFRGSEFRTFAHPPAEMLATLREHGLGRTYAHSALVWQIAGAERMG